MFNFFEDGLACSGPKKWFRFGVINLDEGIDFLDEILGTDERSSAYLTFGEAREPALDLVEPGCIGGRIMDMKAWSRS